MFTTHLNDHTTQVDSTTEPRVPVTVRRTNDSVTFHVGHSSEFAQGIDQGRQLLQEQTWEAETLLQFIQQELSDASVHHLGKVAGLLSTFAKAAMTRNPNLNTFIIACDPEFADGVFDGCRLLPTDWDLSGKNALWEVGDLLQFVQFSLHPASLAKENEICETFDAEPHTSIYNLGRVAGLLSTFTEAALKAEGRAA